MLKYTQIYFSVLLFLVYITVLLFLVYSEYFWIN